MLTIPDLGNYDGLAYTTPATVPGAFDMAMARFDTNETIGIDDGHLTRDGEIILPDVEWCHAHFTEILAWREGMCVLVGVNAYGKPIRGALMRTDSGREVRKDAGSILKMDWRMPAIEVRTEVASNLWSTLRDQASSSNDRTGYLRSRAILDALRGSLLNGTAPVRAEWVSTIDVATNIGTAGDLGLADIGRTVLAVLDWIETGNGMEPSPVP